MTDVNSAEIIEADREAAHAAMSSFYNPGCKGEGGRHWGECTMLAQAVANTRHAGAIPWERMKASPSKVVNFIEWLADQPCNGNGSGKICRVNAPNDPEWCCPSCRAHLLRYGE